MKKYIYTLLTITSVLVGSSLKADECCSRPQSEECCNGSIYLGGFAGVNILQNIDQSHVDIKFKPGFAGGVALGYKFVNNVRIEAELSFRRNVLKSISVEDENLEFHGAKVSAETYAVMANLFYDIPTCYCVTPYFGVGAGWAKHRLSVNTRSIDISGSNDDLALQSIAGVSYKICPRTDLGLEYRYFASKRDIRDHTIALSLKHYF